MGVSELEGRRQLSTKIRMTVGRLRIALLPLALLLVLVNLPASTSSPQPQPQPGLGFLGDLWNIELELWRQAYANVQAERRQARLSSPRRTRVRGEALRRILDSNNKLKLIL